MKIQNDFIKIKKGKKTIELRNMILNTYLSQFAEKQLFSAYIDRAMGLRYCFIKFDTPIEFNENSIIPISQFDIAISKESVAQNDILQNYFGNAVVVNYNYGEDNNCFDLTEHEERKITDYNGRKIATIGFARAIVSAENIMACVDVSNYNIYLENNEKFIISRQDTISSDGIFTPSSNKIPAMAHLCPFGLPEIIKNPVLSSGAYSSIYYYNAFGVLHSVGFSSSYNIMEEELIAGYDFNLYQDANQIYFNLTNNKKSDKEIFCGTINAGQSQTHAGNNRYLIFKYKVWQNVVSGTYENPIITKKDTGEWYYVSIPINQVSFGEKTIRIKYERS